MNRLNSCRQIQQRNLIFPVFIYCNYQSYIMLKEMKK